MGLTSGQGRLLMLTSRLSDIQLDEIMISQRQNQLAWHAEQAAKEYNDKMNNTKLVMKITDPEQTAGFRMDELTYKNMTSMGCIIADADMNIYLTKDADGNWIIPKADALMGNEDIFEDEVIEKEDGSYSIKLKGKDTEYNVVDGSEILSDSVKLQNHIKNGTLFVWKTKEEEAPIPVSRLISDVNFEVKYDTSDDAEAESKYQYETAKISRQDNMLDLELKQLETQHNAVSKEIESVKKLIDDNVERTFNIFSN